MEKTRTSEIMRNPKVTWLTCIRCGKKYEIQDLFTGCPHCFQEGYPASVKVQYQDEANWRIVKNAYGLKRYVERLPYQKFPSLGEGNTPIISLPNMAKLIGCSSFYIKDESQNPTGSHKDRFTPLAVARAIEAGRRPVVIASSGNAALSAAAYAAYTGIGCVVISQNNLEPKLQQVIQEMGTSLILTATSMERWEIMQQMVEKEGYFPLTNYIMPPVGSNPFGVQGYKTVAFELFEQLNNSLPHHVIIPTSRADLLWGIKEGFEELYQMGVIIEKPRLVAVEPIPRLVRVLAGEDVRNRFSGETSLISIGGDTVTWQGVEALRATNGCAVVVDGKEAKKAQQELLKQGLHLELSSATVIAAAEKLSKEGYIKQDERVVGIATSYAWKLG